MKEFIKTLRSADKVRLISVLIPFLATILVLVYLFNRFIGSDAVGRMFKVVYTNKYAVAFTAIGILGSSTAMFLQTVFPRIIKNSKFLNNENNSLKMELSFFIIGFISFASNIVYIALIYFGIISFSYNVKPTDSMNILFNKRLAFLFKEAIYPIISIYIALIFLGLAKDISDFMEGFEYE